MSKIEWTDVTVNPLRARNVETGALGWHCEHVSDGCRHCYAETLNKAGRFNLGTKLEYLPSHRQAGRVEVYLDEAVLAKVLRWRKPRAIFWCSMTDLFGEWHTDEQIDKCLAVMALTPQHRHIVLTKRSKRMREYMGPGRATSVGLEALRMTVDAYARNRKSTIGEGIVLTGDIAHLEDWPLPNVALLVSVEDQATADARIPKLLATPAAIRGVSYEPALGPVEWGRISMGEANVESFGWSGLDVIICGGESGPGARPMRLDWARSARDACAAAGVAFFFKQMKINGRMVKLPRLDGKWHTETPWGES